MGFFPGEWHTVCIHVQRWMTHAPPAAAFATVAPTYPRRTYLQQGNEVSPSPAPRSCAAVAKKRPSVPGIAEENDSSTARVSEEDPAPREDPAAPLAKPGLSQREGGVGVPPLPPSSLSSSSALPRRRSSGVESFSLGDSASGSLCG